MLYLLDANVLIDANRDYYPLGRVPEFWDWLVDRATKQQVKIPLEMYEEVLAGKEDDLTRWLKDNRDTSCCSTRTSTKPWLSARRTGVTRQT